MRDMLYDRLFRYAMTIPDAFRNWEKYFRGLPVYDLTDTIPLLKTVNVDGIPKRLPHDKMWVEWSSPIGNTSHTMRTGFLVIGESHSEPIHPGWDHPECAVYNCLMFMFFQRDIDKSPMIDPARYHGAVMEDETKFACAMPDVCTPMEMGRFSRAFLHTDIFTDLEIDRNPANYQRYFFSPLPLIKAAAMLNCRNIVTDDIVQDKKHPKVKGEREHRPYCSYKVLKIEVPHKNVGKCAEDADTDDGPKQRFHLCRGHFKNLQHERYKNKGWHWWPAHWRGDIERGRVDKSYQLVESQ